MIPVRGALLCTAAVHLGSFPIVVFIE